MDSRDQTDLPSVTTMTLSPLELALRLESLRLELRGLLRTELPNEAISIRLHLANEHLLEAWELAVKQVLRTSQTPTRRAQRKPAATSQKKPRRKQ